VSPLDPVALSHVPQHRAFVGMGGNLGDVQARLIAALADMAQLPGCRIEAVSPLYQTKPVDAGGPDYLNAVVVLRSNLGPHELLGALLGLETQHDRTRPYWHAPRTLDLDLLAYGGTQRETARLSLPHPRLTQRAFVLAPLAAVLANLDAVAAASLPPLPDQATCAKLVEAQGVILLDPPEWQKAALAVTFPARNSSEK
jgi:2-amino-4-hydroxy-6-hydroxymethyldihydropteridine diphosphokinase